MKLSAGRKHNIKWLLVAAVGVGVVVLLGGCVVLSQLQASINRSEPISYKDDPRPLRIDTNTLFMGNVYWGRFINDWSMKSDLKTAYPFSRLHEFNRTQYDAWIAGLECPTVAGFSQTAAEEDATLSFNCSPDYLPEAAKWFTAFTLANNHTDNRGEVGFAETKRQLEKHGIQYFGHYDPYVIEDACEVVALPVRVTYSNDETKPHHLPIALCGYHGVFKIPPQRAIDQIKKYAAIMPVIALPHMGAEYVATPDSIKTTTYRAMIDAGADMVLGDHPHWVQTTEAYKGRLIVYSMGNFIFDQQGYAELTRSAAINVAMRTEGADTNQLASWLKIGEHCKEFKDDCLERVEQQNLKKLPIHYAFGVVGSDNNGKIVKPATESQQASILQRLRWSQTMGQLQPPQGSL